jgi:cytidine deaminase
MQPKELVAAARQAEQRAYAPYSQIRVGAALLCYSGKVFTGANIENASLGLTVCAERVAVFNAIHAGERDFEAIAISSSQPGFIFPCGACLQVLVEFAPGIRVVVADEQDNWQEFKLNELLPRSFALGG